MSCIKFETIGPEDDGLVQLNIFVSNGKYSANQDVWIYPQEIMKFGNNLTSFPKHIKDEVVFEYGSDDPAFYCRAKIRAFIFDNAGHSALEVLFNNHQKEPDYADSHFYVKCEANTLNKLGYALCTWANNMNEPLRMELDKY